MYYAYTNKSCIATGYTIKHCKNDARLWCDEHMRSGSKVVITYRECATDEDGNEHMYICGYETYVPDDGNWWDYE